MVRAVSLPEHSHQNRAFQPSNNHSPTSNDRILQRMLVKSYDRIILARRCDRILTYTSEAIDFNFGKLLDPILCCVCRCNSEWLMHSDLRNSYGIFRVCELHTKIKSNNVALDLDSKFWCFHIYIFQMKSHCWRKEL